MSGNVLLNEGFKRFSGHISVYYYITNEFDDFIVAAKRSLILTFTHFRELGKQSRSRSDAASDQGLHYLCTRTYIRNRCKLKMKKQRYDNNGNMKCALIHDKL